MNARARWGGVAAFGVVTAVVWLLSRADVGGRSAGRDSTSTVILEAGAPVADPGARVGVAETVAAGEPAAAARESVSASGGFRGIVLDGVIESAIAGAEIRFDPAADEPSQARVAAVSDEAGGFVLPLAGQGTAIAEVRAKGYSFAFFRVAGGASSSGKPFEIRLTRSAALDVRVAGADGPLPDVRIEIEARPYEMARGVGEFGGLLSPTWTARSDSGGRALLEDLPSRTPLTVMLRAAARPKRVIHGIELDPGELRVLEARLGSGAIRGRLVDRLDRPIAGWPILRVEAGDEPMRVLLDGTEESSGRVATGPDGTFAFANVQEGRWNVGPVSAQPKGTGAIALAGPAELVEIGPDAMDVEIVLVADIGLFASGIVLSPAGSPAASCTVTAFAQDDLSAAVGVRTDAQGVFRLGPLISGKWSLTARPESRRSGAVESESATVAAGVDGLVLKLRQGGTLRGTVVERATGKPRAANVRAADLDSATAPIRSKRCEEGSFDFGSVPASRYGVSATTDDGLSGRARVTVVPGADADVQIELVPGGKLVLSYQGSQARAVYLVRAGGEHVTADGIARGDTTRIVVPGEELEITWREFEPPFEHRELVTLAPGESKELVWSGAP